MSEYYIPRDHVIRAVLIRDDMDEFLDEEHSKLYLSCNLLHYLRQKFVKRRTSTIWCIQGTTGCLKQTKRGGHP